MALPVLNGSVSTGTDTILTGVDTLAVNHTVAGSLTDSMLIACVSAVNYTADECDWNGTPMTLISNDGGVNSYFYLKNPEAGTYDMTATFPFGGARSVMISVLTFTGAKAISVQEDTSATTTYISDSHTTLAADSLSFSLCWSYTQTATPETHTQDSGQTERSNLTVGYDGASLSFRQTTATREASTVAEYTNGVTISDSISTRLGMFAIDSEDTGFTPQVIII